MMVVERVAMLLALVKERSDGCWEIGDVSGDGDDGDACRGDGAGSRVLWDDAIAPETRLAIVAGNSTLSCVSPLHHPPTPSVLLELLYLVNTDTNVEQCLLWNGMKQM